ncbi:MAG TPA: rRNA maturation RNase YbeY [Candidatus Azoamicus sp. MARI]
MKIKIFNVHDKQFNKNNELIKIIKNFIKAHIEINIIIMNKSSIKFFNNKYRKKNNETDILTFKNKIKKTTIDIILCPDIIKEKHKSNWKKIILHGLLHVVNYEHKIIKENKIMEKTQNIIGMSGIEPPTITTSK